MILVDTNVLLDLVLDDPKWELESMLAEAALAFEAIPREALFLAGKAFVDYRRRRGTKRGVLPDFYIGAHAAVAGWPLLTRDPSRYQSYFPGLQLIAPDP